MSKTKENDPVRPQRRVSGSHVGLSTTQQSDEFFTDSILESDATRTSKIPNPIFQKAAQTKSRRSRKSVKAPTGKAQINNLVSKHEDRAVPTARSLQPAIDVRRTKSPSPLRNRIAATPPQARIRTDIASPGVEIQSPPPEEFTDVYRQIADEEDLAATERESSSSDDSPPAQSEDEAAATLDYHRRSVTSHRTRSTLSPTSRSSTPTRHNQRLEKREDLIYEHNNISEDTGMSFLNELSDRHLAVKMTPHMSESAKDRARLREVWSSSKPVAFTKVGRLKPSPHRETDEVTNMAPLPKRSSKADHAVSYEDYTDHISRPISRHSDGSLENYAVRLGSWDETGEPLKDLPTNARVKRHFTFSRRHGFPQNRPALTEQNLEQQNRSGRNWRNIQAGHSSPLSHHSEPVLSNQPMSGLQLNLNKGNQIHAQKIRKEIVELVQSEGLVLPKEHDGSNATLIDWATAAADVPLPSKESNSAPPSQYPTSQPQQRVSSPEKLKRWDIDLTGQSFQVSESPPVRSRPRKSDSSVGREIENLTKRAVTTNRLGEIRERHSQEQLGGQQPTSATHANSVSPDEQGERAHTDLDAATGQAIPNTPVIVYRSSSSSSSERKSKPQNNGSQGSSDEYLQRFARAMSNTPKSSPASTVVPREGDQPPKQTNEYKALSTDAKEAANDRVVSEKLSVVAAATPKVIGAWTDTILPDTIKTNKKTTLQTKYLQTPHVSIGGWVDTPMVTGARKQTEMTPIAEEVPEELVDGIAKGKSGRYAEHPTELPAVKLSTDLQFDPPKVGLAGILDRAKQRLISQDITLAARENDTLNLGNETIESLQDLLTLDADEFTVLSKVFNEDEEAPKVEETQAEAVILERIGAKLDRLKSNIHEARKGISKLEHKVSQPDIEHSHENHATAIICAACNKSLYTTSPYPQSSALPVVPLHITLPVPLLFHLEPDCAQYKGRRLLGYRVPRLTPLGYLTLTLWLWYLVECTLSEIYSHPTHAEYYAWPSLHNSEPEFPYVLPTMLSRWLQLRNLISALSLLFGWINTMLHATTKVLGMWFGWTDGFIDSQGVKKMFNTVTTTAAASMGMETDMSMMNDEFL